MKCPKCHEEMLTGYLQSDRIMAFNKHIYKASFRSKDVQDVFIVNNLFSGGNFTGFICKDCEFVVFDYSNPNVKEK